MIVDLEQNKKKLSDNCLEYSKYHLKQLEHNREKWNMILEPRDVNGTGLKVQSRGSGTNCY